MKHTQRQEELNFINKTKPILEPLMHFQSKLCQKLYPTCFEEKFDTFEISTERLSALFTDFAQNMLKNQEFKSDFLNILSNKHPNVVVKFITDPKHPKFHEAASTGRIEQHQVGNQLFFHEEIGKTAIVCPLGKQTSPNTIETDMEKLAALVHEIFHATSEKHIGPKFISPNTHAVGEIEGIFGEKLFFEYLKKHVSTLPNFLNVNLSPEWFKLQEEKHAKNINIRLAKDLHTFLSTTHKENKFYRFRYIVGHVFLPHLVDAYHTNPEFAMKQFNEFRKRNSHMDLNDATAALTDGAFTTAQSMIGIYKLEKIDELKEKTQGKCDERDLHDTENY
ncbi:MAG: hypothetical protein J6A28_00890 [Clostridia bacterium]|nr:hypothetical protein [Clostridia bacterium]